MATRIDLANVAPVGQAERLTPLEKVADARQEQFQRSLAGLLGQSLQGEVLSKLTDGSFLVKINEAAARLQLPPGAQVGERLPLTLVALSPRPTFQIANGASGALYVEAGAEDGAEALTYVQTPPPRTPIAGNLNSAAAPLPPGQLGAATATLLAVTTGQDPRALLLQQAAGSVSTRIGPNPVDNALAEAFESLSNAAASFGLPQVAHANQADAPGLTPSQVAAAFAAAGKGERAAEKQSTSAVELAPEAEPADAGQEALPEQAQAQNTLGSKAGTASNGLADARAAGAPTSAAAAAAGAGAAAESALRAATPEADPLASAASTGIAAGSAGDAAGLAGKLSGAAAGHGAGTAAAAGTGEAATTAASSAGAAATAAATASAAANNAAAAGAAPSLAAATAKSASAATASAPDDAAVTPGLSTPLAAAGDGDSSLPATAAPLGKPLAAGQTTPAARAATLAHAAALLSKAPLTPASQLPPLDPKSTPANLSDTARAIAAILTAAQSASTAPVSRPPLVDAPTVSTEKLAANLKEAIAISGLFYESHVADWAEGKRSIAELTREPQMQKALASNSTDSAQFINQQLTTQEHSRVNWQGQIWPGQAMQWDISRDAPERDPQAPGKTKASSTWRSGMRFRFAGLGSISATVVLNGDQLHVHLLTEDGPAASVLRSQAPLLENALAAAGSPLSSLAIRGDADG